MPQAAPHGMKNGGNLIFELLFSFYLQGKSVLSRREPTDSLVFPNTPPLLRAFLTATLVLRYAVGLLSVLLL